MANTWTFSPLHPLMEFHHIDIYPGEGEYLRLERLAEFGRLYHMHKGRDAKYRVKVEGFFDRGSWTQEWVIGRRSWIYYKLFEESHIPQTDITLGLTFDASLGGIIRVAFTSFDSRLPGLSLSDGYVPKSAGDASEAAIDPRCRPINGFSAMPQRRIELEVFGKSVVTGGWVKLGEKFSVELEDGVNGFEKVEAAFKPYALKILENWQGRVTDVKLAGKTVFQAEFDHMKEKAWHTEMASKLKLELSGTIKLPGGVSAKVAVDGFVKDPVKWMQSGKFKGGGGITIDFEY